MLLPLPPRLRLCLGIYTYLGTTYLPRTYLPTYVGTYLPR